MAMHLLYRFIDIKYRSFPQADSYTLTLAYYEGVVLNEDVSPARLALPPRSLLIRSLRLYKIGHPVPPSYPR